MRVREGEREGESECVRIEVGRGLSPLRRIPQTVTGATLSLAGLSSLSVLATPVCMSSILPLLLTIVY